MATAQRTKAASGRHAEKLEEPVRPKRVKMICKNHGYADAYVSVRSNGDMSPRCLQCQSASTRRSRAARASHPQTPPGSYFMGKRTTQGMDTEKKQVPIAVGIWKWLDAVQDSKGATIGRLINEIIAERIKEEDPSFDINALYDQE
jgi:hypothetical protein